MLSYLLFLVQTTPATTSWNLSVGIIMIFTNLSVIIIGYFAIQQEMG
jgi:hypothetical protein